MEKHHARAMDQQRAQVRIAALADTQKAAFASGRVLSRHNAEPRCQLAATLELSRIANRCHQSRGGDYAHSRNAREALRVSVVVMPSLDDELEFSDSLLKISQVLE